MQEAAEEMVSLASFFQVLMGSTLLRIWVWKSISMEGTQILLDYGKNWNNEASG